MILVHGVLRRTDTHYSHSYLYLSILVLHVQQTVMVIRRALLYIQQTANQLRKTFPPRPGSYFYVLSSWYKKELSLFV